MATNTGKWNTWYHDLREPAAYGATDSYLAAADWLKGCGTVGDWGCGKGFFREFVLPPRRYYGFDGSRTPFADLIVDLTDFTFHTDGVLIRHVIEHDEQWERILRNATASFGVRMMVVVFTPLLEAGGPAVKQIGYQMLNPTDGVPDLSFSVDAIVEAVGRELLVGVQSISSATQYGAETLFTFER